MKSVAILDSNGKLIRAHVSDMEFPAIPPRPIPYVFPNHHVGTIRRGENFLGCLDVYFYCGTDSYHSPTCFTLWCAMSVDQEEDGLARSELMGVLYLDENSHMANWDVEGEWRAPYIRALVHACIQDYFQLDGENPENCVDFGEYQRWAEAGRTSQIPDSVVTRNTIIISNT
ncbi:MAG: hypothetical protein AB7S52_01395 [Sphaerochaetaceae bacterium]